jgi:hypothetical protein
MNQMKRHKRKHAPNLGVYLLGHVNLAGGKGNLRSVLARKFQS